ncbi:MAG: amidohydrolase family protein [Candidatus Binatia bacterium]
MAIDSGLYERTYRSSASSIINDLLFSADSHVMEPEDTLVTRVPKAFRDKAPRFPGLKVGVGFQTHPGGSNPKERIKEMASDGVSAEVLYPTYALGLFAMEDAALQEACIRAYNDWLIEYCQVASDRLVGVGMISTYNVEHAVQELERCAKGGLRGAVIWEVPPKELSFTSAHYERFWAAAQDLDMPVSLHILTGFGYAKNREGLKGVDRFRASVNWKLAEAVDALMDVIFSGVLERYPRLKVVLVENEAGWLPYVLEQWDYYFYRHLPVAPLTIDKRPSEYFNRQVYVTFFNDAVVGHLFSWWGEDNCMWSNDFPHANSTWPYSREVVSRDLGYLSPEARAKLVRENVARLYNMPVPKAVATSASGGR